ncbi:MAG: hypothetical protein AAF170_02840 [Bacteroidota bacterium]
MSRLLLALLLAACGGSDAQPLESVAPLSSALPSDTDGMRVVSIAAGEQHSIAVLGDGSVWTWGNGSGGALGRESTIDDYSIPVHVPGLTGLWADARTDRSYVYDGENLWTAGYNHDGGLGYGPTGEEPIFTSRPFSGLAQLDAFGGHIVARKADSTVWVWGDGRSGQLGNGTTPSVPQVEPLQVELLERITTVSAGSGFSLALQDDGRLWAWGQNNYGTLGTTGISSSVSTTRTSESGAVSSSSAVARMFSAVPVAVMLDEPVMAMAGGGEHALAVLRDSTVWAWGRNQNGEVGQPDQSETFLEPVQVPMLSGIVAVEAGSGYSLALQSDGTLWMWGGTSGMHGYDGPLHRPRRILRDVAAIEGGTTHAFAVKRDGTLYGWGLADVGQVGADTEGWPPVPVRFDR